MADIDFWVETALGNQLLDSDGGGPIGLTDASSGFGVPPVAHRFIEGAGPGGIRRNTRTQMRPFDVGLIFLGDSRTHLDTLVRDFAKKVRKIDPAPKFVARYASGEIYELPFLYQSGLEINYKSEVYADRIFKPVMSLIAPDPYWVAQQATQYVLSTGATRSFLPKMGYMRISQSQVIGTMSINNPGDVEAYPTWEIVGPVTSGTSFTLGGITFSYNAAITTGHSVVIDTDAGTAVYDGVTNVYSNLSAAPKLFPIPAGDSTLVVNAPGADSNTRINLSFKNRREVIL